MSKKNKLFKVCVPCSELHYIANSGSDLVYSPYLNDLPIEVGQEICVDDFCHRFALLRLFTVSDGLYLYTVVDVHF